MNTLDNFVIWLDVPIQQVNHKKVLEYIDYLCDKRLQPKTINNNLDSIRCFYNYLQDEEDISIDNPVKRGYALRLSKPLPKHLKDEEVVLLLHVIKSVRDRAMFMLMLRCGLRVAEVANLRLDALDLRRGQLFVINGKGAKDRVVYLSKDAFGALIKHLKQRRSNKIKRVFLVEKGSFKGKHISVRGIQKRIEYYSKKSKIDVSCHQLRHTMATQLLNADTDLVAIQDLLGHSRIRTTQRYCKVSNLKVQRDYHKAMERIAQVDQ
jgi:site-specific recombinase XerD